MKTMWTIFIITITWTHLVCGQCCGPRPFPSTIVHEQPEIRASTSEENPIPITEETRSRPIQNFGGKSHQTRIYFPDDQYQRTIPSELFDAKLFQLISAAMPNRNFCISPISLQILLTFISTLSEGKLLDELSNLLSLPHNNTQVVHVYQMLTKIPQNADHVNNTLILANKLYYDQRYGPTKDNLNNYARSVFATEVDPIDFLQSQSAVNTINSWVAEKTRQLIQNAVLPNSLNAYTNALLINSLYFKSEWKIKFASYDTVKSSFHLNSQQSVKVDMMHNEDVFRYGEFENLEARVLELPYQLDDFTMMIILPNEIEGLASVERQLSQVTLKLISHRLQRREVIVKLPKFDIEFDIDMVSPLQKMGLHSLFNEDSRINIFKNQGKPLVVDSIRHKTYVNVNEVGTEAAAITVAKIVPLSLPIEIKHFVADHPFIFVIRNSKAVYFIGHVVNF
ncbi:serine protease inhibitor 42Dd-like [Haematobia irritans]|uniref:serine protease inhibitor 42Dd-like n=1 Tax=Haematobia irritans TaxID=7368 RepID=UPI003F4F9DC0